MLADFLMEQSCLYGAIRVAVTSRKEGDRDANEGGDFIVCYSCLGLGPVTLNQERIE